MKKNLKIFSKIKFIHLIDHNGTIFRLVSPLSSFTEHYVLTSFPNTTKNKIKMIEKLSRNKKIKCILHTTGNKKDFYKLKEKLAEKFNNRFYLFLHVSPNHFLIKGRFNELKRIKELSNKGVLKILTTSKELKEEYSYYGLKTIPIQIGIEFQNKKRGMKYNTLINKKNIISVCTAEEEVYQYIKGIDQFSKLIKDLKLDKQSLILGNKNQLFNIKTKKVSQDNFFNYLRNSLAYIQLSRTEAYNLSAVYAKRLKIPIIVSNIEGHKDNIKFGFRINNLDEAKKILRFILRFPNSPKIRRVIERNYKDSLKRETLNNFRDSFNKL